MWVEDAASTLPYKSFSGGSSRLAYNRDDGGGNWSQQEVGDGEWVSMTLIATNDWHKWRADRLLAFAKSTAV